MPQRPGQHRMDVGKVEGVKRFNNFSGVCALLMHVPDALETNARLSNTQSALAIVPQRDRDCFQCYSHCLTPSSTDAHASARNPVLIVNVASARYKPEVGTRRRRRNVSAVFWQPRSDSFGDATSVRGS